MPLQRPFHRPTYSQGEQRGGGKLKSWAQSILSGVGVATSPDKKARSSLISERRRSIVPDRHFQVPQHGNFSFSTYNKVESPPTQESLPANVRAGIVLVHLQEQLPKYCQLLQEPTFTNAQEACQLLAKAIARSLPSSNGSPKNGSPHSSSSPGDGPSPGRSPLRSFFGGRDTSPPTKKNMLDSAAALEREWERYTMPLQLLATAEALYANLHHAQDSYLASASLEGLYRWLLDDLALVKETLCDSVGTTTANQDDLRSQFLQETAQKLAPVFLLLASLAKQRCRLIQYQSTLWETGGRKQFGLMAEAMENMGKNWTNEWGLKGGPITSGLVESLSNELAIWKHLLETASYLEKCRYVILGTLGALALFCSSRNFCTARYFLYMRVFSSNRRCAYHPP